MRLKPTYRTAAVLLALAILAPSLTGCGSPSRFTATYYTYFDTVTTVIGYGSERQFNKACGLVKDVLERYHRACDIYHEYSGMANACTLNRLAGQGSVEVAPELAEVLSFGRDAYRLTDGACNIAMGAVLSLWHDCRETALSGGAAVLPDENALLDAAGHCAMEDLIVDVPSSAAELRDPLMRIDLGAVAKGYAAERAAEALKKAGLTGYALNLGGNVRTVGVKGDGEAWVGGIEDPFSGDLGAYVLRVSLNDKALVTSGSYQRWYEVDGMRYHHIISPDTLFPARGCVSVTVLSDDSGLSDALSTALFVIDPDRGVEMVDGLEGVEACWILPDGSTLFSRGFAQYILQ